jgi:phosphatidylinositol dimannoside acyltransferase
VKVRDALVVASYRSAAAIAPHLPRPVAERGAEFLATVLKRRMHDKGRMLQRHQQRLATAQLGHPIEPPVLDQRVDAAFASYARYWVDSFRLIGLDTDGLAREIEIHGLEHADAAFAAGTGGIAVMPHIGAWDLGGAWFADRYPLTVVAERLEPPALFDWFVAMRKRNGMEIVALGDPSAGPALIARLRSGGMIGLLCDRDIAGGGVEVEFFGERTTMAAGPATLALRTGAPLLPTAVYQRPGQRALGVIRPPIAVERTGRLREDIVVVTQLIAKELEALILRAPEQWHVLLPNWPSDTASVPHVSA